MWQNELSSHITSHWAACVQFFLSFHLLPLCKREGGGDDAVVETSAQEVHGEITISCF